MSRQRLLIIVVPALVVGGIEVVSDTLLDSVIPFPLDAIVMTLVVLVIAAALSGDRLSPDRAAPCHAGRPQPRARRSSGVGFRAPARERRDHCPGGAARDPRRGGPERADPDPRRRGRSCCSPTARAASGTPRRAIRPARSTDPAGCRPRAATTSFDTCRPSWHGRAARGAGAAGPGGSIGTLAVGSSAEKAYAVEAVETLASLRTRPPSRSTTTGSRLELRELAVGSERERIAREMHDGLAQVLGYVNTKSQAGEELLADGRTEARGSSSRSSGRRPVGIRRRP